MTLKHLGRIEKATQSRKKKGCCWTLGSMSLFAGAVRKAYSSHLRLRTTTKSRNEPQRNAGGLLPECDTYIIHPLSCPDRLPGSFHLAVFPHISSVQHPLTFGCCQRLLRVLAPLQSVCTRPLPRLSNPSPKRKPLMSEHIPGATWGLAWDAL